MDTQQNYGASLTGEMLLWNEYNLRGKSVCAVETIIGRQEMSSLVDVKLF